MSRTLLFQGDSITDCGRVTCGGAGFPTDLYGPGYPGMIASKLLGEQPEASWNIINRGISGNRIVDLYARWKADALNLQPDIISLLVGVNDTAHEMIHQNGVELSRYERFYREILDWTLQELPHCKFILMEPFVFHMGVVTEEWLPDVAARGKIVRKIAEDYNMPFVPLQSIFDQALKRAPREYWLSDGVHPLPSGHQLIMNAWLEAASTVL